MLNLSNKAYLKPFVAISLYAMAFVLLLPGKSEAQPAPADMQLWEKAVEIAKGNQYWMPENWSEVEVIYDDKGRVEEKTEKEMQVVLNGGDDIDLELVRAVKNGEDILETAQAEFEQQKAEYLESQGSPFDVEMQPHITVEPLNIPSEIEGCECKAFAFSYQSEEGEWDGIAWIDATTGIPVETEVKLVDVPFEEEGIKVETLVSRTIYNSEDEAAWYPLEVVVKANFSGKWGFFKYQGTSDTSLTFSGYQNYQ